MGGRGPLAHFGRYICLNCPRGYHLPPFLPIRFDTHIRRHLRHFPTHLVAWWCWDHCALEEYVMLRDGIGVVHLPRDPLVQVIAWDQALSPDVLDLAIRYREEEIDILRREVELLERARRRLDMQQRRST